METKEPVERSAVADRLESLSLENWNLCYHTAQFANAIIGLHHPAVKEAATATDPFADLGLYVETLWRMVPFRSSRQHG